MVFDVREGGFFIAFSISGCIPQKVVFVKHLTVNSCVLNSTFNLTSNRTAYLKTRFDCGIWG